MYISFQGPPTLPPNPGFVISVNWPLVGLLNMVILQDMLILAFLASRSSNRCWSD